MKSAVIIFPGSNCDRDMCVALHQATGEPPHRVWHGESELPEKLDIIAIPGGFSYGDYLRAGAIAARSPIIRALMEQAKYGVKILGVCNGFQILTETGLLPGALLRNAKLRYICRTVSLSIENGDSGFTQKYGAGAHVKIPVAHHDGNYFAQPDILDRLEGEGRIAFRYQEDVNGSCRNIAGILNSEGTILGMMPHPERAFDPLHGSIDGRLLFESLLAH